MRPHKQFHPIGVLIFQPKLVQLIRRMPPLYKRVPIHLAEYAAMFHQSRFTTQQRNQNLDLGFRNVLKVFVSNYRDWMGIRMGNKFVLKFIYLIHLYLPFCVGQRISFFFQLPPSFYKSRVKGTLFLLFLQFQNNSNLAIQVDEF